MKKLNYSYNIQAQKKSLSMSEYVRVRRSMLGRTVPSETCVTRLNKQRN